MVESIEDSRLTDDEHEEVSHTRFSIDAHLKENVDEWNGEDEEEEEGEEIVDPPLSDIAATPIPRSRARGRMFGQLGPHVRDGYAGARGGNGEVRKDLGGMHINPYPEMYVNPLMLLPGKKYNHESHPPPLCKGALYWTRGTSANVIPPAILDVKPRITFSPFLLILGEQEVS